MSETINLSNEFGLNFGSNLASNQVITYLNLKCPDSKAWFLANQHELLNLVNGQDISQHIKLWNKDKEPLQNGNIANKFIDYSQPDYALQSIKSIFETQDELNNLDNADVATYLQENHNLTLNPNAEKVDKQTLKEVEINGLTSVPTVIVNGTQYIDDQLAPIDELLKKG